MTPSTSDPAIFLSASVPERLQTSLTYLWLFRDLLNLPSRADP